jgi:hypothetical protein
VSIMFAFTSLFFSPRPLQRNIPARLAIYYGYPSLVNGSSGNIEQAAKVFGGYEVVVLGDGIEFPDRQPGRHPEGDPAEHQKSEQIISMTRLQSPRTHFYGYICLGDIGASHLSHEEIELRIRLWKGMGVSGIFLDEAGYDWPVVDRERQNRVVRYIHEQNLSVFANAFYPEDLFSSENLRGKNPGRLPSLLDQRDILLLESFQIKAGDYEDVSEWQQRLKPALDARAQHKTRVFATTTPAAEQAFNPKQFNYAWWSAWLYDLDGFSWGEPNFAAVKGLLPDRRCQFAGPILNELQPRSDVQTDKMRFWRSAGSSLVLIDTRDHSVHLMSSSGRVEARAVELPQLPSLPTRGLDCGEMQ